jgi:polyhydroxyalkanoate synthesis regulator phasin
MKVIEYYKKKNISEADDIQNGVGTGVSDEVMRSKATKVTSLNAQIAELVNQRLQKKTQYQQDVKNIESKIVQLQKQIADMGEKIDSSLIEESCNYRFSRALFESIINRTDEMYVSLKLAFDKSDVSYTPSEVRLRKFAKNIISFINKDIFNDSDNKEGMLYEYINNMLNNSHVSLSNNEKNTFMDNFIGIIKDNVMFSWIFEK